jgi:hypothetical protein
MLEVRAQRRWRDPDVELKHGNGKVTRGVWIPGSFFARAAMTNG